MRRRRRRGPNPTRGRRRRPPSLGSTASDARLRGAARRRQAPPRLEAVAVGRSREGPWRPACKTDLSAHKAQASLLVDLEPATVAMARLARKPRLEERHLDAPFEAVGASRGEVATGRWPNE